VLDLVLRQNFRVNEHTGTGRLKEVGISWQLEVKRNAVFCIPRCVHFHISFDVRPCWRTFFFSANYDEELHSKRFVLKYLDELFHSPQKVCGYSDFSESIA